MANRYSQSPPLQHQVPNQMRTGTEIPLDPDMPEPELTTSTVAGDSGSDNLGLFYHVDEEALKDRASVTIFMIGGLVFTVEDTEIASNIRDFILIMYGNNWEK